MMTEIKAHKCDQCGTTTEDYMDVEGWIVIQPGNGCGAIKYSMEGGRGENRIERTKAFHEFNRLDFCCFQHMIDFLRALEKKKKS